MPEPVDWVALRSQCASDETLVSELIALFRREVDGQLLDVAKAVSAKDPQALSDAAHRIKGALVALAAGPATERAVDLERCGARAELALAPGLLAQLRQEITLLLAELDRRGAP